MSLVKTLLVSFTLFTLSACSSLGLVNSPDHLDRLSEDNYLHAREVPSFRKASYPQLPTPKVQLTPEVEKEVAFFSRYNSSTIRKAISRKNELGPVIEKIFVDEGIPLELLNLAIIESCFNPEARSSAGAVGLWQFMKSTASVYGLEVGYFEDQRKDPILSTLAAARHIRDLYLAYSDWNLALAAYNAGSGSVDRAIIRAKTDNFWELARQARLREQTRRYVAKFYAVMHITNNPQEYGLGEMRLAMSYPTRRFG
ncbi:MAG: lytic transglycosylase domain-containing protein [Bdellovibrionales bacterium]|nr:lytic transglycosylase domain-containing protein [Bdellovibrionales bacterium]